MTDDETSDIEPATNAEDWPSKASNMVVGYVDTVRNKTTGPALIASRYAVHLVAIALLGIIAMVVGLIVVLRLSITATGELSFVDEGDPWLAYFIIGSVFVLIGVLLWRKKEKGPKKQ